MKVDWNKLGPFWDTLFRETDRACAVLAGTILENILEDGLTRFFVSDYKKELFGPMGPLGTFSSKTEVAYAIGIIPKCARDELSLVRKIRNEFAHGLSHELRFDRDPIRDLIFKLAYPRMFRDLSAQLETEEAKKIVQVFDGSPRRRFEYSVGLLAGTMRGDIERKKRMKSPMGIHAVAESVLSGRI